jgi:RHS repeat-associated protein
MRSYTWGLDLSESLDGAAGIGGLLHQKHHSSSTDLFTAIDGHGDLIGLVNAANTNLVAVYEYGPFGDRIRESGPFARLNPFASKCKFTDRESGLVYYGERFYSPELGRWLNRDPIEEEGGNNLYAFAGNNPINRYDPNGTIAPLLLAAYIVFEVSTALFDTFDAIETIVDPEARNDEKLLSVASVGIGLLPGPSPKQGLRFIGMARDNLLSAATSAKVQKIINELFRPRTGKNAIGSGSAMDAYRHESKTGQLLSPKGHRPKLEQRRTQLLKVLKDPATPPGDKQLVKDLLIDIQGALSGY